SFLTDQMDPSQKKLLQEIKLKILSRRGNAPPPRIHLQRISDIRSKFEVYSEDATPKPALSNIYSCVGRIKFYPSKDMFMNLELSNIAGSFNQSIWPVRATWQIEMIEESDSTKTFPVGENHYIFNKPRQGFVSHCSDMFSITLDQLEESGMIGPDGSVTFKWSVSAFPALELEYLELLEDILLDIDLNEDRFDYGCLNLIRQLLVELAAVEESLRNLARDVEKSFATLTEHL
ncbi:hypothetical protein Btru_037580, partial [Bulinus truncatus]